MAGFVKLDSGIIRSSLWMARDQRSVFITALVMAEPFHLKEEAPQIQVRSLDYTGWMVPAGWYGMVHAAGTAIIRNDGIRRLEAGLEVLEQLCSPDSESRSHAFDGRRMARIDGGYLVLNYYSYRERDYRSNALTEGYVYYAKDGDLVKIGFSKNPWARLASMKTTRHSIVIVATERGDFSLETQRHKQFEADCIDREWFRLSPRLASLIAELGAKDVVANPVATVATTKRQRSEADSKQTTKASVCEAEEYPADFEMLWRLYPKRAGSSKKQTSRLVAGHLKAGVDFDVIHDGTLRYVDYVTKKGWLGTEFVKTAQVFYGRDQHFLSEWEQADLPKKLVAVGGVPTADELRALGIRL